MRWIEITKTNTRQYDGLMLIDADKLVGMQRVSDGRGTYTALFMAVPDTSADEGDATGGFAGFDVRETPEEILAMLATSPRRRIEQRPDAQNSATP